MKDIITIVRKNGRKQLPSQVFGRSVGLLVLSCIRDILPSIWA
jgi:hypothetical protein